MPPPPPSPVPPPEWTLTPSARAQIFNHQILAAELLPLPPSPRSTPLALLVVGQTGAGKSHLSPPLLDTLHSLKLTPAHLIADTYKTYHPRYLECLSRHPPHASRLASYDARIWLQMACSSCVERKLDVLVESACRHPDDFITLARIFKEGGYVVKVVVMGVPLPMSRLGIAARFWKRKQEGRLPVRLTPKAVHDESYEGLGEVCVWLDSADGEMDGVVVVRRGGGVVYAGQGGVREALGRVRGGGMTGEETRAAREEMGELRGLGATGLEEIEGLIVQGEEMEDGDEAMQKLDVLEFVRG
ncbi:hypothetical protein OQA88_9202 [Cercophora sp. LCS_1]